MRKRQSALALAGEPVVKLVNEGELNGLDTPSLDMAIGVGVVPDRLLGKTEMVEAPSAQLGSPPTR